MAKKFYITTAIDYVNARPHCGHAFEKTLADAIARLKRLLGYDVFFLTGVDENAQKNVEAADKAGVPVKEFLDRNTALFLSLCEKLNLSHDAFIRTTAKEHAIIVQKILKKIIENKDIYKGVYEGLYCHGCETYYTEKDLVNGKCPEHNREPELRKEEAYFFKLSKYKSKLLKIIPKYVIPEIRRNEILARINEELNDICISRRGAKWGIDFPDDKNYKVWVWIDALINYISGLKDKEEKYWPADIHVIGKGINWFHSVIWPAMLLSAGYALPDKLLVHGYLNISGKKMSKSLGNVLDPLELLNKYKTDTVRYSLLRNSVFEDSDYSEEKLVERHNHELADKLGNLISRVSTLVEKYGLKKSESKKLDATHLARKVKEHLDNLELDKALGEIFAFIDKCNEYVQEKKPWETKDKSVLYEVANAIKDAAILLSPFIPETSEKIAKVFNFDINIKNLNKPIKISKITKSPILFQKIDQDAPQAIKEKANKPSSIEGIMTAIDFKDWEKIDLRVGKIEKIEDIEGADKLYKLTVNIGKESKTVCAGLKKYYSKDQLKNKTCILFVNLKPKPMKGTISEGMILAATSEDESKVILIQPEKDIEIGSKIR